jgi:hypothetical protein
MRLQHNADVVIELALISSVAAAWLHNAPPPPPPHMFFAAAAVPDNQISSSSFLHCAQRDRFSSNQFVNSRRSPSCTRGILYDMGWYKERIWDETF